MGKPGPGHGRPGHHAAARLRPVPAAAGVQPADGPVARRPGGQRRSRRVPPLSSADWREVASLLAQAAKTRFFAAWRAEEDAGCRSDFGPSTFIVSLREPQPGDWPPVLPPGTPLIDPAHRAADRAARADRRRPGGPALDQQAEPSRPPSPAEIRSANETGGFQAMLQQALGDPQAGDPLPVNIDTLAQQLDQHRPGGRGRRDDGDHDPAVHDRRPVPDDDDAADHGRRREPGRQADARAMGCASTRSSPPPRRPSGDTRCGSRTSTAAGLTYWMALKAKLPLWRASAGQRSQWHAALAQRSLLADHRPRPDRPGDMINPVTGDPAFGLWNERTATVAGRVTIPGRSRPASAEPGRPARPGDRPAQPRTWPPSPPRRPQGIRHHRAARPATR